MNWMRPRLLLAVSGLVWALSGCGGDQSAQNGASSNTVVVNVPAANVPAENAPVGNSPAGEGAAPAANAPAAAGNTPAVAGNAPAGNAPAAAKPKPAGGPVKVVLETSKGAIELELAADKASVSVQNFLGYVRKGFYNGTLFHRVIPGFMIQGGGFDQNSQEKPTGDPIKNEGQNGLKNQRGTIAMARTGDPNSATAQFFINVNDNTTLDYPKPDGFGYAVFGKVTKGMDVVDKIVTVPTEMKELNGRPSQDVPVTPVIIKSAKVVE